MASNRRKINTSTAMLARRPFWSPCTRAKKNGTPWRVDDGPFRLTISDMVTEDDCDLIEWLLAHGRPQLLADGRLAFAFSLYAAAHALDQGRARIVQRIRRRMQTLIDVRDGDWEKSAQIFGPTLRNLKDGRYIVTTTAEFADMLSRGVLVFYAELVDDILPIRAAVVRRLVRRTLSHDDRLPESLDHILDDMRFAYGAKPDSARRMRERAIRDILAARDYLTAVFGIEFTKLRDGRDAIVYSRDRDDRRIWIQDASRPVLASPEPGP
ncbi:MAG: hypothetical protein ACYDDQ_01795 [Vulcanimicrobiaceae bacterium]